MSDRKRPSRRVFQVENLEGRIALSGAAAHFAGSAHPFHAVNHFRPAIISHGHPSHFVGNIHRATPHTGPMRFYGSGTPGRFEAHERPGVEARGVPEAPSIGPDLGPNRQVEQQGNFKK